MRELTNIKLLAPVSSCLHPRFKRVPDTLNGGYKVFQYGCGHCWNCIHSFRESWRIRLYETMMAQTYSSLHGFIYDTLTVSNSNLPSFSSFDYFTGESVYPLELLDSPKDLEKVDKIVRHYGERIPFLDKSVVSHWLKRGRDNYNQFYKKDIKEGRRPKLRLKFFGALEYGPLWSRPHVHICVFGVNRSDWSRFWGKVWRREMGFTKTKWIDLSSSKLSNTGHCSRISTYISKYLMKGCFDSPLVKYGIIPSPWRVVSHGIGEELLQYDPLHRFDWLLNDVKFHMGNRINYETANKNSELYQDVIEYCKKFSKLLPIEAQSLKTYVKDGYNFVLPRYYSDKLLCVHSKGLAGATIKASLFQDACNDCFEAILSYASDCRLFPRTSSEGLRSLLLNDLRSFNFACHRYFAFKKVQDLGRAKWHRLSSLNSYNRLRSKQVTGDIGLLL